MQNRESLDGIAAMHVTLFSDTLHALAKVKELGDRFFVCVIKRQRLVDYVQISCLIFRFVDEFLLPWLLLVLLLRLIRLTICIKGGL